MIRLFDLPAQPFFLPGKKGDLFAIYHPPHKSHAQGKGVVFVPPFAEEMNKSRRMFSLQARRFAKSGIGALIIDLYGTGDSRGDFKDAQWDVWKEDISVSVDWLRKTGIKRLSFLGLRLGSLLALDVANELLAPLEKIVLWQPVTNGEVMLTQFLRLRLAASMMASSNEKESTKILRNTLGKGQFIEVAGYDLTPELARAIDALRISSFSNTQLPPLHWLEVVANKEQPLSPASRNAIDTLHKSKVQVDASVLVGEPFWSTAEITLLPDLLEVTTRTILM